MFDRAVLRDKKFLSWAILVFIGGFLIGLPIDGAFLFQKLTSSITAQTLPKEWREGQTGLINPLLGVNYPDNSAFTELVPLQSAVQTVINNAIDNHVLIRGSVYFRDMSDSHWIGVNETETYSPASLIKIPMMVSYFKVAESNPNILNKLLQYTGPNQNVSVYFKPADNMVSGQYYSVSDLIRRMIVYSDNNAILMLFNNMDKASLDAIFSDLSITVPKDPNQPGDYITPGNFSRFFRTLYNATYLNEAYSQKALELLSEADFKQGLVAGVPGNITVAHKFGETPDVDATGKTISYELHDCGIIYAPNHPYILCVMTSGQSYDSIAGAIKDISAAVYSAVKNNYK